MKRLFTYILALSLLPQIVSAAVLVGKTEGTFALSPKGSATYTIPLTIQKGMSDFKPELSLFYDSNAENGIMGLGWSIKGMHTITKVNKCQHFDGTNQGKAYALDGMRMILGIGVDGQIGAMYKTEHDKGDIISITAMQNGAPATFKVKASDGSIYIYGSSTGRYINGDNSMWALDYAQDALGNYISYTYDQNGGLYPTSITYGRNIHGTAGVNCVISFTYDSSTPKRLTKIECRYNGNIYRSYTFSYSESPLRLTSLTEGGRSTYTFAPTTFSWAQNRIASITDGLGATDSFTYCNLNDNNLYSQGRFFPDNSSVYRLENGAHTNIKSNIYVVKSRTESITTDSRTTNYFYTRGIYHKYGKGFLGFGEIEGRKSTGVKSIEAYNINTKYAVLLPYEVNHYRDTVYQYLHKWEWNTLEIQDGDNVTYRTKSINNGINSYADGYGYGHFQSYHNGLPTNYTYDDGYIAITDNTIAYWESSNDTVEIKGLPSVTETSKFSFFDDGADPIYETTTYERDNNTGLVIKKTKQRGGQIVSTDGYAYNEYGQVTQHYTVAYNSTDTLVTTYQYNSKGQLYKEHNPLGQYKTYSYNANSGLLSSVSEFDGSTMSYTYDGMLRETKCSSSTKVTTTAWSSANYGEGVYSIKVSESNKTPVTTYYDAWGRKTAELTTVLPNTKVYTDYKYNSIGKLGFVSFPHQSGEEGTLGTNYFYADDMYWVVRTEDSNGKINTWNYHDDHASDYTTCIDGITTWTNYLRPDVIGDITYDDGSSVHYAYNGDGNVLKAVATFNSSGSGEQTEETNYEYDASGRLVRITDMNGVIKEYTYDANGYPYETRIGDSYVRTNYDKFGRLMSKTWYEPQEGSHTVNYTYNTALKKKHLVAKEQGDNYTYTYSYDIYGRLTGKGCSVTNGQGSESITTSIEYNSNKQVSKKVCSFGFCSQGTTEIFGYKNGVLVADTLGGFPAYRLTKQDRWGNPTEEKLFFGTTTRLFDDYGHMLSMNHTGYTPLNYAISDSCEYDLQTGNLIAKNGFPLTYNGDNRLTGWASHNYSYDEKGNITHQSSVGDFTYNGFKLDDMTEASGFHTDDSLSIIYYKALGRPISIKNDNYKAEFSYDADGNRILMEVYKKERGQFRFLFRRYYLGSNVEITVDSLNCKRGFYYAGDDPETAPAVLSFVRNGKTDIIRSQFYQTYRDNAGSALLYEDRDTGHWFYNYSPWGVRTRYDNVTTLFLPNQLLGGQEVYRTYKGYEDLWMFGLLYDKTRLYDPYLGRYLSPNPEYTITGGPLDHNPYVFSNNNPLRVVK